MENADIAVIVPVYNRAGTVLETLQSVAAQTLCPRRLIVVDDGSTDRTAESVHRWRAAVRLPFDLEIIRQPNRGAGAARNRGIAACGEHCRFLAFLDSDDLWPADFLARTRAALRDDPDAVAASAERCDLDLDTGLKNLMGLDRLERAATEILMRTAGGVGQCSLFRAEVIRGLGGFDEDLPTGQDSELYLRVSIQGRWRFVPGEAVIVRRGLPDARGEEGHLSRKYADGHRRAAQIREDFVLVKGGRRHLSRRVYRRALARRWYMAGRELMDGGRFPEARDCLRRSLRWQPLFHRAWFRLARSYLAA